MEMNEAVGLKSGQHRSHDSAEIFRIEAFPDELLAHVLGHLARRRNDVLEVEDDLGLWSTSPIYKRDLSAASMVSKRWRACALAHLFRDIVVRYFDLVKVRYRDISSLKFLDSHPQICSWITNLSLVNNRPDSLEEIIHDIGQDVLARMPQMRVLALVDVFVAPSAGLPRLKIDTLHFIVTHYTETIIRDTFHCFSTVKQLHVEFNKGGSHIPLNTFEHLSIQSLSIRRIDSFRHLVDALLCSPSSHSMTGLAICNPYSPCINDSSSFPRLIRAVSNTLVSLELGFSPRSDRSGTDKSTDQEFLSDVFLTRNLPLFAVQRTALGLPPQPQLHIRPSVRARSLSSMEVYGPPAHRFCIV